MSHDHDEKDAKGDLLPCPFCGEDRPAVHSASQAYWSIMCMGCGAEGEACTDEPKAVAAWNRRADTARIVAEGYTSGTATSDFHGAKITLRYTTSVQAEAAFAFITDSIDAAIRAQSTQPDAANVECGCCPTGCPAGQCRHAKENP